jgi:HlyD family secretion protein
LIVLFLGCRRDKPPSVQTETVQKRDITETVVATGRIQPVTQVKISPEVSGEIVTLAVREGDRVKKGDLLVEIRKDIYEAALKSAEASYQGSIANERTAKANERRSKAEYERNIELFEQNLVSASIYDEVKAAFEVGQANAMAAQYQVEVAHAALRRAEDDLTRTTILSPLSGTVAGLASELGERVVGTGMMAGTEIMTIADLSEMEARVEVGEVDVVLIQPGQKARLEVDSFRDQRFAGTVTQVARAARSQGVGQQEATKFEVRIHVDEKAAFLPGMSVTAEIETRHRTDVVAVPIQSVTTRLPPDEQKAADDKVKDKSESSDDPEFERMDTGRTRARARVRPREVVFILEEGKVRTATVTRGISDDTYYEILDGVQAGQEVVTGPSRAISRDLKDDMVVTRGSDTASTARP